jgi:hypothetical protein
MSAAAAKREMAWSIAAFITRDMDRHAEELGLEDVADSQEQRDARRLATFVEPGLSGAFYRAWLYSGNADGAGFGARQPGQMRCKQTNAGGHTPDRAGEELDRDRLYGRCVDHLHPLDRLLLALWVSAHQRRYPRNCAEWVIERLAEHPKSSRNSRGDAWTARAVRERVTQINNTIARVVVEEAKK